jgi:hypothetical protein
VGSLKLSIAASCRVSTSSGFIDVPLVQLGQKSLCSLTELSSDMKVAMYSINNADTSLNS